MLVTNFGRYYTQQYVFGNNEFFPYQKKLREEILELDISADQVRENKSEAEKKIMDKNFSLKKCKDRYKLDKR